MAKKMSKRKTNAIILGVTLTLVMVLLGGVIAAVVTETNPKDWFKQEIQYSEFGEEIVKEYDAIYFDTTEDGIDALFKNIPLSDSDSVILAYIGDGSNAHMPTSGACEEGYILDAMYSSAVVEGENVRLVALTNIKTNERIVIYSSHAFNFEDVLVAKEGFQNLGEDGLLEWDGKAITGAIYLEDSKVDGASVEIEYNGISLKPIK